MDIVGRHGVLGYGLRVGVGYHTVITPSKQPDTQKFLKTF